MSGETDLNALLRTLTAELVDGLYVFVTLGAEVSLEGVQPRMMFREEKGITYIMLQSEAVALGVDYEFPCRMITLTVHSSLDAVGFIARIASELAKVDMGVNPVSGFFHDHLFVPDGRQSDALEVIEKIASQCLNEVVGV